MKILRRSGQTQIATTQNFLASMLLPTADFKAISSWHVQHVTDLTDNLFFRL